MLHNCVGIALPELAGKRPPFLASKVKSEFLDALASLVSILETQSLSNVLDLAYLGHIFGVSWAYSGHIFDISWAYLWHILGIFWVYLGHILGISWAYLGHILGIFGHILGMSWAYLRHILGIH